VVEHTRQVAPQAAIVLTSGYLEEAARVGRTLVEDRPLLWKPYTASMVLNAIRKALENPRATHVLAEELSEAADEDSEPVVQTSPPVDLGEDSTEVYDFADGALVVTADAETGDSYRRRLVSCGFPVTLATHEADALQVLEDGTFGFLLLDLDASQLEAASVLRKSRSMDIHLPVIVATSGGSIQLFRNLIGLRDVQILQKPFSKAEFDHCTAQAVRAGRVARLQQKLLASRAGADRLLRSLEATEEAFEEALATLRMVYQPIVRSHDDSIFGYEALLRCDVPLLPTPPKVIAAAEALGRVKDLGRAVRGRVASDMEQLDNATTLFVNLHPSELRAKYLNSPKEPLLPHAPRIVLEVTERASLSAGPGLLDEVRRLRNRHYQIAVDDLGQGFAGLSSLAMLTPDIVKIDMSLVRDIDCSPLKEDIVASIVLMARRSGITVVGEGVETAAERDTLATLGCDLLQGYFFSRPAPPFPTLD
jgi:EAL domain-containing protein (putative c-di-GMP-specific phosphodiesterase class I)